MPERKSKLSPFKNNERPSFGPFFSSENQKREKIFQKSFFSKKKKEKFRRLAKTKRIKKYRAQRGSLLIFKGDTDLDTITVRRYIIFVLTPQLTLPRYFYHLELNPRHLH